MANVENVVKSPQPACQDCRAQGGIHGYPFQGLKEQKTHQETTQHIDDKGSQRETASIHLLHQLGYCVTRAATHRTPPTATPKYVHIETDSLLSDNAKNQHKHQQHADQGKIKIEMA